MKQFIHPKFLKLFYYHEETDEIKSVTIPWENVLKFEVGNITQSIRTKDTMVIQMDILHQLELRAKNVICDNEPKTDLPLYEILPYKYRLYELTIIDKRNQYHTYGVSKNYNSYTSSRSFNEFTISFK